MIKLNGQVRLKTAPPADIGSTAFTADPSNTLIDYKAPPSSAKPLILGIMHPVRSECIITMPLIVSPPNCEYKIPFSTSASVKLWALPVERHYRITATLEDLKITTKIEDLGPYQEENKEIPVWNPSFTERAYLAKQQFEHFSEEAESTDAASTEGEPSPLIKLEEALLNVLAEKHVVFRQ